MRALMLMLFAVALMAAGAQARAQSCSTITAGPATFTGIVNTYYPGSGTAGAGSTSISIGAATGAATPIASGDLLIVIQMQDASINTANNSSYGGSGGGQGQTSINNSGLYEYAVATNAVGLGGGTVTLAAGLLNTYRSAAANATSGQKTFQVVRVPQASSATITGPLQAPAWNGTSGGIVAIDVIGNLTWGGQSIDVAGRGYRGGGGQCSGGTAGFLNTDYRTLVGGLNAAGNGTTSNGAKGEGVAGTPIIVFTPTTPGSNAAGAWTNTGGTDGTSGGYPAGSFGRGAPGNGGGGGTDGNPTANDQNTGGAGGGNYGIGGKGGYGWTPGTPPGVDSGGFGGMSMPNAPDRLFMGGGGGAGSTNNCTGTPGFGVASSGAAGGGMVFVRAGTTTGTVSILASGTNANSTITNDASGGGGAGGTVLVFVDNGGGAVGASIDVRGGNGGSNTGGGAPHGPGGGGSGGFAIMSGSATVLIAGGVNGTTATSPTSTAEYGSSPSVGGSQIVNLGAADIPGSGSTKACFPRLTVTKATSTPFAAVGSPATWTITVANQAGRSAATGVTLSDVLPNVNITYASTSLVSLLGGATRPTVTDPTAGTNTPAWSSFTIPGGGSVALTFIANSTGALPPATYQNPANVSYLDPTRTAAGQTVTPGGTYVAGPAMGTVPGSNYASGSTTNEDVTFVAPPAFTKTFNPTAITVGAPTLLTVSVTNPGGTALTSVGFIDTYPAGVVNTASPGATTSCGGSVAAAPNGTGFSLAGGTIPAGGSCTVTVNVTMTSPGPYINTIPAGALTNTQNVSNPNPASATLFTNIRVVKSFSPNAVAPNTDSTLSLAIVNDNTAPMNLANPGLTDVFPAGLVATGGPITVTGAGCTGFLPATVGANATAVVFTAGLLPAASTCTVSFAVRSATTGIYANTTSGVTTTQSGTTGPVSNTANLGVGVINLAKAFSPLNIVTGGTSTVTLTLTNPTGVAQTGGNFTDTLVGMAVSGAQNTGGTCTPVTALTNGQTALSFTGLNVPTAGCTITFVVTSSTVGAQSNTTGGVATALLPRGPASNTAPLNVLGRPTIAKAFSPTTISAGGTSTLTFTISNPSPIALSGATFTDTYPAGLVNASPLAVGGSCTGVTTTATAGGNTFNVTAGNLPASSSCTITVAVTSAASGSYSNTSSAVSTTQTGGGGTPSNTAILNVATTPTITKAFGTSPIAQGGTSTITFTIANPNAGVALTNVRFTDTLTGMSVSTAAFGGSCAGASNSPTLSVGATALDITIPTIAAASNCTVTVTVSATASGSWPNTTSGVTSTQTPVAGTTSNTATLVVLSPPMLMKSFAPSIVQAGVASTITFTITNPQGTALTNVAFTDTLVNMSVASAQATGGTCGLTTALTAGQTALSYTVPTLAANSSCTITLTVSSSTVSPAGGHPNTTSTITSTQTPTTGGTPGSANLTVIGSPTITKAFSPSSVAGTAVSTITFTLTNPSSISLTNVRFTDAFPAGMRTPAVAQNYIGAGRGTCVGAIPSAQGAVNVTTLNIAGITMPANSSCTITVDIELTADGTYTNTTSGVISNQTPTASAPASAVISRGRLGITKSFTPATAQVGGTATLSFALLNPTGAVVNNITLTDTFPAGMVATGGAVTVTGACTGLTPATVAANAASFAITDLDGLPAGGTCTVSLSVTVTSAGVKANTATIAGPAGLLGGTSTANLTVFAAPTIAKSFTPATIAAGGISTITFTLTNPNTFSALNNASFTDALTNMTVADTVVGGTCLGTTPSTLTIGATALAFSGISIPANGSCTVTVDITSTVVGTRPNTVSGVTTTQTPTAGAGNGPINLTVAGLNITKSFTPANRPVGVPTTLTFVITSPSAVAWSNIAFTDTLPANLVIASPSNASTSCVSGVVTAAPGSNVVSLAGATMTTSGSPCTVNVDVVSSVAGTYNNAAANFSGLSPGASYTGGTVSVVYFANSTVTKAFAPATISPGATSTLTFTINNPAGAQAVTGLGFTDTLPANVVVAATPAASNTCGATFAPAAGSSVLTLTGGSRPAGASSCTAQVNVTSSVIGTYNNATGNFSALTGGLTANTAAATLNVVGTTLTKAFTPAAIGRGGVSTLTFTITNGAGNPAQAGLAFLETLPTNVFVAGAPAITNTCGGTVTAAAASNTIQLAGGSLAAAAASCTFSVNVTSAIAGSYFNGPSNITGEPPAMETSGVNATLVTNDNPGVAKAFNPAAVGLNTNSQLTITLSNANSVAITGAAFTDTYPGTVVNAPTPAGATTCGGTVTAVAGGTTLALAGGTIPANGSCTVTVFVRSGTAGSFTNDLPIGAVSSTNAGVNSANASAVLNVLAPITVTKAYSPNPALAGTAVTLTITLTNPNAFAAATGAAFSDPNPAGILNTATANGATTCAGGTVTAANNGNSVALAGGTVPAAGSCTVTVQQSAAAAGAYTNTLAIGSVTTTNAGSNTVAATTTLNTFVAPTFSKAFAPATIGPAGTSTLTFTIANPAGNPQALTGVAFTDTFPVAPGAMVVATPATPVLTGCGAATFAPVAGAASISFSNGTIAVGGTCTVSVNVTATATGTYNNTSSTVTASGPLALTGTTASGSLTISQPTLTKAFVPASVTVGGAPSALTFTITNGAGNPAQSGIAFTDTLPAGLVVATPNGLANTCPAGTVTAVAGSNSIALTGGTMNAAQASCTITVNVVPSATPTTTACPTANNTNAAANITGATRITNGVTAQCLTVTAAVPTFDKVFSGVLVAGSTVSLTFTVSQPANNPTQTFSFTDTLPAGLVLGAGGATGTCTGGTVTATAGSSAITVAGRQISGASCTIVVPVTTSGTPTAAVCPSPNNTNGNANISATTNIVAAIGNSAAGGGTSTTGACVSVTARPTVTKAYSPNPAAVGAPVTLTITLANANTFAITGAAFTDTNPVGVLNTATPAGATTCAGGVVTAAANGTSVALAGGTIPAGGSCTVTVQQSAAATGSFLNTIAAGDVTTTNGGSNATPATSTLVVEQATLTKAFAPATVSVGGTTTLTFTLTNSAGNPAQSGIAFTDTLPAGLAIATPNGLATTCPSGTAGITATAGGNSIAVTGAALSAAQASCTISVNVTPSATPTAGACPQANNTNATANITGATRVTNNVGTQCVAVTAAVPTLDKVFSAPLVVGATVNLTFTVSQPANNPVQAFSFTDTLPAGLAVAAGGVTGSCTGGTVTATVGSGTITVAGRQVTGASCTIVVPVTTSATPTGAICPSPNNTNGNANISATTNITPAIQNSAVGGGSSTTGACVSVTARPTVAKAYSPDPVAVGAPTTLTITLSNTNTFAVTGAAFTDTNPVGVLNTATPAGATTCAGGVVTAAANGTSVALSGGTIPAGGTCTVTVQQSAAAPGAYVNTIAAGDLTTTNGGSNAAPATDTLNVSQATLTKAFAPTTLTVGGAATTLTFTLTNGAGNPAQSGIAFTDTLPAGLAIATPNGLASTCPSGTAGITATAGSNSIAVTGATMSAAMTSCTISVDVTTSATPTAGACPQPNNTNAAANITGATRITNGVTAQCVAVTAAVPTLNKAFSGALVAGSTINLTFTISQPATNPVQAFSFTDTLPAGLVLGAGGATGTCTGGTVTATAGSSTITVAGRQVTGASCTIVVPVTTSGTPTGAVCPSPNNTNGNANISAVTNIVAAIANSAAGGGTSTTGACVSVTIRPTVAKAYSPNPVAAGAPSTLTITLSNANTFAITGAAFTDTNPAGVLNTATPAGATTCGGTVTAAANGTSVALAGGTIPAGGSCTVTVQQAATAAGSYLNTIAAGDLTTTNGGSNATPATDTLTVAQPTLTKTFAPTNITVAGSTTLTFLLTNSAGNPAQSGIAFTDTLPAGLAIATPNGLATTCPSGTAGITATAGSNSIAVTGASMNAAQASCTITVNVTTSATPTAGACPVANNTNGPGNITGATRITNNVTAQCVTVDAAVPTLNKAFSGVLVVGSTINLTFTVSQVATNPTQTFSFTDTLPAGLVLGAGGASGTCTGGTVTATAGSSTITVAGRQVSGASCTIIVPVTTSGTPTPAVCPAANNTNGNTNISATTNITAAIANSAAGGGTSTTGACVSVTARPTVTKAYSPNPAAVGAPVTLTITLANSNTFALTGAAFTDTNPAGVLNTAAANGLTTCAGGTVTAANNGNSVALAGGTIPAGGSCTVTVQQSAAPPGSFLNTIAAGGLTTTNGGSNATAANSTLVVEQATLTKAFTPTSVVVAGAPSVLTFTLNNGPSNLAQSGIAFTDTLPVGLMVASPNGLSTTCPAGTFTATALGNTITASGVTMTAGMASCVISVNVTPSATPTSGACPQANNTNGSANISGLARLTNAVTNQCLSVNSAQPVLDKSFSGALVIGGTVNLTFTISQPIANPTQTFSFTDTLPAGLVVAAGGVTGTCTGGTVTATAGSSTITVAGRQISGASCTIIVPVTTSGTPTAGSCPVANNTNGNPNITGTTNVNASIANSAAGGGTSATGACVSVIARPTVTKAYSPNPAAAGSAVTLTITLSNSNGVAITGAAFTDTNPAGVLNTATPAGATTCGGTVTAAASGSSVALAGGTIPANSSCTVTVQQVAAAAGSFLNTIAAGDVTTTNGGSNTVPATATLVTLAAPTFTKAFAPATIGPNGTSTLTFTLTNPAANTQALTGVAFGDTFPTTPGAMVVAGTPAPTTTGCGAPTFTPVAGAASIAFSGGTIAVGGTCTVTVNVTAPVAGTYNNTSGTVTTTGPAAVTGGTASATLTVAQPTLTKAFAPTAITINGTPSTLTFTLTNATGNPAQSGIAFTDTLPAGLVVATPNGVVNNCPAGTVTAVAGSNSIALSGGTMNAAQASCTITINVSPSATPTTTACPTANNTNAAANITGATNVTNGVTAQCLTVNAAIPTLNKVFSAPLVVGSTVNLTFTISQPATNPAQTFSFTDTLPAGLAVAAGGVTGTCTGGTVTATAGSSTITVAGRQVAGASCTIIVPVTTSGTPTAAQCPSANNTNGNTNISATTNITAAIQNSNQGGAASTTGACVSVTARPTLTKAYSPNPAVAGAPVTLTITLFNSNSIAITGAAFTDTNPAGVLNTAAANGLTTCALGVVTAANNGSSVALAGGTIPANGSCTVTVQQSAAAAGSYLNTIPVGALTTTNGGSNATAANATLVTLAAPTIAKAFGPATIGPGGISTLTFTITNPAANTQALTGVAFTDTFPTTPAAMVVAGTPAASTTGCGAPTFTPVAGAASITFSGGSVAVGGTCTVTVNVTAPAAGTYNNTSGAVSATGPVALTGNTASSSLTVAQASLTKVFTPSTIDQGGFSTLTFTLANGAGNPAQSGIAFTDTLPAGLVVSTPNGLVNTCPAGTVTAVAGSNSIALAGGTMNAAQASCTISVNVTTPTPGTYNNTNAGNITGATRITTTGVNATLTVQILPTLTKAFGAASVALGGTTTLTFTINNTAPSAVSRTGISFTDTLPAGISIANPPAPTTNGNCGVPAYTAANNTQPFTANTVDVAAGATCTITIGVRGVTAGTAINGNGNVTTTGLTNGVTNQPITVVGAPTIAKIFGPATIAADGSSTITFTITNPSATVPLTGAGFTDTLSAMSIFATAAAGGTCAGAASNNFTVGATNLAFTGITVPAASSCTVTVVVTSDVPGPHNNTTTGVTSNEAPTGPASNTAVLTVTAGTPTIGKVFAPTTIAVGTNSTITFTLSNPNGSALTAAGFTDTLSGMSIAAAGAAGGTCAGAASNNFALGATNLAFTGLTIPANGNCTVTVVVTSTVPGTHNNQASGVSSAEAATGAVSNTAVLTVTATAPTITKAFAAPIASGGVTTLTITVSNANAAPFTVTSVTDNFPTTPGAGMLRAPTPAASTTCAGGTVNSTATSVTLTGGTVPANSSCTFQIDVTAASTGSYVNTIPVGALTTSIGSNTAAASATLTVSALANLAINKAGPATIATGATITYTITVTNAGPDAANNATYADNVPAAITGVGALCVGSAGAACGAPVVAGNSVTGTIGTLPVGGIATITITGTATGAAAISNTATVSTPPGVSDPVPANNSSTFNTTVQAADLTIAKSHVGNFVIGTNGTYTLVVSNIGSLASSGTITVSDALPTGLGFVSATGPGWTCGFAGGIVTCTSTAAIAAGASGTPITLVVSVASVAAPSVNNIASVSGGGEPPSLANNNIGSDNTLVGAAATNRFSPNGAQTALPGTVVFYPHTFNAGSAGNVSFSTTSVITPATPGWQQLVYRDADCNGVLNGAEGNTPLTTPVAVNAGDAVCIVVRDAIPIYAPYNSVAVISVTATFNGTETYVQQDITTVGAVSGAGLTLSKMVRNVTQGTPAGTSGTARPDDVLEYTITYTNAASGPLSSIVVTDAVPAFTTFQSAACPAPPPSLTGCTVTSSPAVGGVGSVVWTLAGSLNANGVGSVTYQVKVVP